MPLLRKSLLVSAVLWACSLPHAAQASTIAFSGTFTQDNGVLQLLVGVLAPSTFTAQTTSYAAGGFDPILTLYDPSGAFLLNNDDRDFFNGEFDAFIGPIPLLPGVYTLVLTQSPNFGTTTLGGGFDFDGTPSFTLQACVDAGNCDVSAPPPCDAFVDFFGNCRGNNYAGNFEITQVDTAVPEPGTIALLASGLGGLLIRRGNPRRRPRDGVARWRRPRAPDHRPGHG